MSRKTDISEINKMIRELLQLLSLNELNATATFLFALKHSMKTYSSAMAVASALRKLIDRTEKEENFNRN